MQAVVENRFVDVCIENRKYGKTKEGRSISAYGNVSKIAFEPAPDYNLDARRRMLASRGVRGGAAVYVTLFCAVAYFAS